MQNLTESNFLVFAAQHYDSVFLDDEEFQEDLKRIVYIKRLFNSYVEKKDLKERLIINHLVVLFNVFGQAAPQMLFLKLQGYESILKTFLCFINRMPTVVANVGDSGRCINTTDIPLDPIVWQKLVTL